MDERAILREVARSPELQQHVLPLVTTHADHLSNETRALVEVIDVAVIAMPFDVD